MMEQKSKFISMGIRAEYVGESQVDHTARTRVLRGEIELVFISPESMICNPHYRNMLLSNVYKKNLIGVAVDEAHCVKTW